MTHQSASFDPTGGCKTGPNGGCKTGAVRRQRQTAQAKALRYIDQYDFCLIATRVRSEGVVPAELVDAALDEFRKFCKLVVLGYDCLPGRSGRRL